MELILAMTSVGVILVPLLGGMLLGIRAERIQVRRLLVYAAIAARKNRR